MCEESNCTLIDVAGSTLYRNVLSSLCVFNTVLYIFLIYVVHTCSPRIVRRHKNILLCHISWIECFILITTVLVCFDFIETCYTLHQLGLFNLMGISARWGLCLTIVVISCVISSIYHSGINCLLRVLPKSNILRKYGEFELVLMVFSYVISGSISLFAALWSFPADQDQVKTKIQKEDVECESMLIYVPSYLSADISHLELASYLIILMIFCSILILCLFWRFSIIFVNKNMADLSQKSRSLHKTFIHTFALQAIVPLIVALCCIAYLTSVLMIRKKTQGLGKLFVLIILLSCSFDFLVTLIVIKPYYNYLRYGLFSICGVQNNAATTYSQNMNEHPAQSSSS